MIRSCGDWGSGAGGREGIRSYGVETGEREGRACDFRSIAGTAFSLAASSRFDLCVVCCVLEKS
jgi:hypothetical protein